MVPEAAYPEPQRASLQWTVKTFADGITAQGPGARHLSAFKPNQ